jgi:hypothetical protein
MTDFIRKHENQLRRGLTYDLWKNFPLYETLILRDLSVGFGLYPQLAFYTVEQGNNNVMGSDGAQILKDTENTVASLTKAQGGLGGGLRLGFHATDNHETYIQWGKGSPFAISTTAAEDRELIFECAFRTSTITNDQQGFVFGLAEEGCAAADFMNDTGGVPADKDYLLFWRKEGAGNKLDFSYRKAGQTRVDFADGWKTIVAETWYHAGFRWNPINRTIRLWFGTGDRSTTKMAPDDSKVITATHVAAATFPNGEGLCPIIGVKQAHATASTLDIRLLACGQLAAPAN